MMKRKEKNRRVMSSHRLSRTISCVRCDTLSSSSFFSPQLRLRQRSATPRVIARAQKSVPHSSMQSTQGSAWINPQAERRSSPIRMHRWRVHLAQARTWREGTGVSPLPPPVRPQVHLISRKVRRVELYKVQNLEEPDTAEENEKSTLKQIMQAFVYALKNMFCFSC